MTQNIFPALRYRDADAALEWLKQAFGAQERAVYRGDGGGIQHAELLLGEGLVMYGSREYSARDLEGNLWSFGTYDPKAVV